MIWFIWIRTPLFRDVPGMTHAVGGPGKTQDSLEGPWIFFDELESAAGQRDVWVSLLDLLHQLPDHEQAVEDEDGEQAVRQ